MGEFFVRDFRGGLDLFNKDTDIAVNAYPMLFNGRTRKGKLEAINRSLDITYNLRGKFQGLYGIGSVWIAFYSGFAYYMPVGGTVWFQVPFFSMDSSVDYIYACAVPGVTGNFLRQAVLTQQVNTDGTTSDIVNSAAGIIKTTPLSVGGLPGGVVVQDGINRPWLLSYDADNQNVTARVLGGYNDWTQDNPEYVPVGTLMMYLNQILYIVLPASATDGNNNTIGRSVSGQPLNFMVNIDTNGNPQPTESAGGAYSTSFAFDFDSITALLPFGASSVPDSFLVCTINNIYGVNADFNTTIFGEPTFDKQFQVQAGVVNQFCVTDSNGDTPFIDLKGIKFFNGVQQLKFRGMNDPRSLNINSILMSEENGISITQNIACCTSFDNYNLFAINTTLGYLEAVYDNEQNIWVSLDINNSTIGGIKMYGIAFTGDEQFLAAGTLDNRIMLKYGRFNDEPTEDREACTLFTRAFISGDYAFGTFYPGRLSDEHKANFLKLAIVNSTVDDTLMIQEFVDYKRNNNNIISKDISGVISGIAYPVIPPVIPNSNKRVTNLDVPLSSGALSGYKISYTLGFKSDLAIERIDCNTNKITSEKSDSQSYATNPL